MIVGLHHLHGRTSGLPSLSSWQSSAHYYGCSVPSAPAGHVLLGSVAPAMYSSDSLKGDKHCWAHGKIMVGSIFLGSIPGDKAGCYEIMGGESDFNSD
jgi:hypothetical protein